MSQIERTWLALHLRFPYLLVIAGVLFFSGRIRANCPLQWGAFENHIVSETSGADVADVVPNSYYFNKCNYYPFNLRRTGSGKDLLLNCTSGHFIRRKDELICRSRNKINQCNSNITPKCDFNSQYRTIDGSCNNKENPHWGRSFTCLQRYLPAHYSDDKNASRKSVYGSNLISPREISRIVHRDLRAVNREYTQIHMQWGQCVSHDIMLSLSADVPNLCCSNRNPDSMCFPMEVYKNDTFYRKHGITCLEFTRTPSCKLCETADLPLISTNEQTSFLDASLIYGPTDEVANSLKNETDGTLNFINEEPYGELPTGVSALLECVATKEHKCFLSGDVRVNAHPSLTAFHIILMRYHNMIARKLKEINPKWEGEKIFQEARKILAAQVQMITYADYLPLTLGNCLMDMWNLKVERTGFTQYNHLVDPSVFTDFGTAAMRFGHSTIPSVFPQYGYKGSNNSYCLRNFYNYPFRFYEGQLDPLIKGMAAAQQENVDPHLVVDAAGYFDLFTIDNVTGLDLAAMSIHRSRDRGLAPYADYLEYIFSFEIRDFDKLYKYNLMPKNRVKKLKKVFRSVRDINFYSGFLSEYPVKGGIVGPSAGYLIAEQFYRLKYGDSFYFEHENVFKEDQLEDIRRHTTLAKILCETVKIEELQKNVFLSACPKSNPITKCADIPGINFELWKDTSQ